MDEKEYQHVLGVKRAVEGSLLDLPGVHGVSIGYKRVQRQPTSQVAIAIHLSKKRPLDELSPSELIPSQICGIATDVLQHAPLQPAGLPLKSGDQITNGSFNSGTLGAFVHEPGVDPKRSLGFLTCQHVVQGSQWIWCPFPPFGLISTNTKEVSSPTVDAAVCWSTMPLTTIYANEIISIGPIRGTHILIPPEVQPPGYPVRKYGRTTGLTSGKATNVNWTRKPSGEGPYEDQIAIFTDDGSKFCEKGDSGSAVMNEKVEIVGLLWGYDASQSATVYGATPIAKIESALNISVISSSAGVNAAADIPPPAAIGVQAAPPSARAQVLQAFYEEHGEHLQDVFEQYPEVVEVWRVHRGEDAISKLCFIAQEENTSLPPTLADLSVLASLNNIATALKAAGRPSLAEALVKLGEDAAS